MAEIAKTFLGATLAPHLVQAVLRDAAVQRIRFRIAGYIISPGMFESVANLIGEGKLKVRLNPALNGGAEYDMADNTLYIKDAATDTVPKRAMIIHEAVHAGLDALHVKNMTVADSETAAYIAQCCYARLKSQSGPENRILVSNLDKASDQVFELAWAIAGKVLEETQPSAADLMAMRMAVLSHANYKKYTAKSIEKYDGVT